MEPSRPASLRRCPSRARRRCASSSSLSQRHRRPAGRAWWPGRRAPRVGARDLAARARRRRHRGVGVGSARRARPAVRHERGPCRRELSRAGAAFDRPPVPGGPPPPRPLRAWTACASRPARARRAAGSWGASAWRTVTGRAIGVSLTAAYVSATTVRLTEAAATPLVRPVRGPARDRDGPGWWTSLRRATGRGALLRLLRAPTRARRRRAARGPRLAGRPPGWSCLRAAARRAPTSRGGGRPARRCAPQGPGLLVVTESWDPGWSAARGRQRRAHLPGERRSPGQSSCPTGRTASSWVTKPQASPWARSSRPSPPGPPRGRPPPMSAPGHESRRYLTLREGAC